MTVTTASNAADYRAALATAKPKLEAALSAVRGEDVETVQLTNVELHMLLDGLARQEDMIARGGAPWEDYDSGE